MVYDKSITVSNIGNQTKFDGSKSDKYQGSCDVEGEKYIKMMQFIYYFILNVQNY